MRELKRSIARENMKRAGYTKMNKKRKLDDVVSSAFSVK